MDTKAFDDDPEPDEEWTSAEAMVELREMRAAFAPLMMKFKENTQSLKAGQSHPLDQVDDTFQMIADMLMLRYGRSMWMNARDMEQMWK